MRLGLLTQSEELYSTRRIVDVARDRGHRVEVLPILRLSVVHGSPGLGSGVEVCVQGTPIAEIDVLLPRIGTFMPELALTVVGTIALDPEVTIFNSAEAIERSRNKIIAANHLAHTGLPVPHTRYVKDLEQIDAAFDGPGPWVIKPLSGAQGRGVMRVDSPESGHSVLEGLPLHNRDVIVQEYLAGGERRALVVDGEVVAAVERTAAPGRFRANHHQGGASRAIELSADERELAVAAVRTLGLDWGGVDLIDTDSGGGVRILEVNSSPGLEGIEAATSSDLTTPLVAAIERRLTGE